MTAKSSSRTLVPTTLRRSRFTFPVRCARVPCVIEEAVEIPTGGVERSLIVFTAVIQQRPAILNHPAENRIHGLLPQRRIVMEFADELAAKCPHVVDVFLDRFGDNPDVVRCSRNGRKKSSNRSPGGRSFSSPIHDCGQPCRSRQ